MILVDEEVEDFLEHHGVKGQKWGVRNFVNNFQRNRELNKTNKAKRQVKEAAQFEAQRKKLRPGAKKLSRAQDIQRARDRIDTGALKADKKAAKVQYKKDKINKGSKEARRILKSRKNALANDVGRSQEAKSGLEAAQWMIQDLHNELAAHEVRAQRAREESASRARQQARDDAFRARYSVRSP